MTSTTTERPAFSNVSNKIALSIGDMYQMLAEITGGWPKVISGDLCYRAGDELRPLSSSTALFAWIDQHATVHWQRGAVTKEEFYEGLRQQAEQFAWFSPYPHFPKIPGVYYTCKLPAKKSTGALDELLNRFEPASAVDRQLLKGMVMTPYWGGPKGKRPSFVITSKQGGDEQRGCGVGKTTLVEVLSKLVGGYITVRPNTNPDRIISGLLSPSSWSKRIALIDNLKSYRFSNDNIESLVTCEEINGHRLHHGFAERPNFLTWMITVNGASFSKDMAQRSVVIFLKRPKTSATWYADTAKFIEEHREEIVADIRWHLEKKPSKVQKLDRWPDWGAGVLSRLDKPDELLKELTARRGTIDEDDQDAADVIDHVRACLCKALPKTNPDAAKVQIPTLLLAKWVRGLKTGMSDRQAAQYLKQLQSPRLQYRHTKAGRVYLWSGKSAGEDAKAHELIYKIDDVGK